MALTCPGRYADERVEHGIRCQIRHHPEGMHHAHHDTRCIVWVDDAAAAINSAAACPKPPTYEAEQQARCTTCQQPIGWVDCPTGGWWSHEQHPADGHDAQPYLRDEISQALSQAGAFCGECGFEPGEIGCPDCVRVRHAYVEAVVEVVQPRLARRTKIRDLEGENDRLRADLAQSRRDALFTAVAIVESTPADTSAYQALRATIVAKLRVEALTNDECAKCAHRRGDHLNHGGVCTVRRSSTTVCGCARYGHAVMTAAPKED